MITKATGFRATDGSFFATAEEAQRHELERALKPMLARAWDSHGDVGADNGEPYLKGLAGELLAASDILLAILTTGPKSRPGARKRAGTTNPRRATATTPKTLRAAASNGATSTTPPPLSAHVEQIAGT